MLKKVYVFEVCLLCGYIIHPNIPSITSDMVSFAFTYIYISDSTSATDTWQDCIQRKCFNVSTILQCVHISLNPSPFGVSYKIIDYIILSIFGQISMCHNSALCVYMCICSYLCVAVYTILN